MTSLTRTRIAAILLAAMIVTLAAAVAVDTLAGWAYGMAVCGFVTGWMAYELAQSIAELRTARLQLRVTREAWKGIR